MFSPEKNQVEICLLKSNLEEIENELIVQRSAWPKFDAENEKKFHESLNAVKVSRALSVEIEKLNQDNVRLVAKRMHLKMQSEELAKLMEKARQDSIDMETSSNNESQEIELEMCEIDFSRKYEDLLREKTARFRESRACFDENEMKRDIENINHVIAGLENEVTKRRTEVDEMKRQLDSLAPDVPEDLLIIVGKNELEDKIKLVSEQCDVLQKKKNNLEKSLGNPLLAALRK